MNSFCAAARIHNFFKSARYASIIREDAFMQLLLTHWHCIVPAAAIVIGALLLRKKPVEKKQNMIEDNDGEEA
jgi:hypothetical protein